MENIDKTDIALFILAGYLLFRAIKELAWIRLYSFIIKLKADGKLIPENDPNNVQKKMYEKLLKETKSII